MEPATIVRRIAEAELQPTRRAGIMERRLLVGGEHSMQNVVFIEAQLGAQVELHQVETGESIFVVEGELELILGSASERLGAGDLAFCELGSTHGMRVIRGPAKYLLVFAPPVNAVRDPEWLRSLYAESWRQITHEDVLSQQRNNLFLGIQAALIAILTAVFGFLIKMQPVTIRGAQFHLGLALLGLIALAFAMFSLLLAGYWAAVTRAGRSYLSIRWVVARMIEVQTALGGVGLATIEDKWKRHSAKHPKKDFAPFPHVRGLEEVKIPAAERIRGWTSILRAIGVVRAVWTLVLLAGLGLLVGVIYSWLS